MKWLRSYFQWKGVTQFYSITDSAEYVCINALLLPNIKHIPVVVKFTFFGDYFISFAFLIPVTLRFLGHIFTMPVYDIFSTVLWF